MKNKIENDSAYCKYKNDVLHGTHSKDSIKTLVVFFMMFIKNLRKALYKGF